MVDLLSGENLSLTTIRKADKVKFVGDAATNPFPKLQGMCTTAKTALTKAMTSLERASSGFDKLTSEDGLLTSQRFAHTYMAALEKVENKKTNLESCFDKLIEHVHGMAREDFEPNTDPGAIVESAEETCQGRIAEIELKLQEHEGLVKKSRTRSLPTASASTSNAWTPPAGGWDQYYIFFICFSPSLQSTN